MNKFGKFIVFEGVEGAGKTTQMERVRLWLSQYLGNKFPIVMTREPGGTHLGTRLRQLLLEEKDTLLDHRAELLLYAADRAQHIEEMIKPQLLQGAIILCDRYTDSTIAYQGYGRGLPLETIHQLNQIATGGLESDLTFWLDVDVEIGLSRAKSRGGMNRMDEASLAFHKRVQYGFSQLAIAHSQRIIPIDANRCEEEVQQQIQTALQQLFKSHLPQ